MHDLVSLRGADRSRWIREGSLAGEGPIVYWMNRDMRLEDNWALLYAVDWARATGRGLIIAYNLEPRYEGGRGRHAWFKIEALKELAERARERSLPFTVIAGAKSIDRLIEAMRGWKLAGWVTDACPLHIARKWQQAVDKALQTPAVEVDAHNVVPYWIVSPKLEFAAYTLRPKIHAHLKTFLTDIPSCTSEGLAHVALPRIDWKVIEEVCTPDNEGIQWIIPGAKAAHRAMRTFLDEGLVSYDEDRNDPTKEGQSDLSPWLHYGQLSAQRLAFAVQQSHTPIAAREAFLEELIVRRELADNFCAYQSQYDAFEGFPAWAQKTLERHRHDRREYVYTRKVWEHAETHDPLWNAAQRQLVQTGKMHGFMRMYWAKKLLEWSESPEEALKIGIALNDAYELDGRDPNGYAGLAWSIGGVHDRAWGERPVFGMIRYMNAAGCKRKFDTEAYIRRWNPSTKPLF